MECKETTENKIKHVFEQQKIKREISNWFPRTIQKRGGETAWAVIINFRKGERARKKPQLGAGCSLRTPRNREKKGKR